MKYSFTVILLLIVQPIMAQRLKVIDGKTKLPVENVVVIALNADEQTVSNSEGIVDLSWFGTASILSFQHPSYKELTLAKKDLPGNTIHLTERIIKMKDVVISANKWEQDPDEIPQEIISISAKEIAFKNPQTSADLLSQSGEVFMQKSQYGGGSPKLRGFAANSVLIVVDGARMNNGIYRSGNLQNIINIDPNALEGAEVVLGPGSVMYGSDALGGVMDFHVKGPRFTIDNDIDIHGTAFTRYSTAANEKTGHVSLSVGSKKLAWFGSFSYSDFDDLKSGSNRKEGYADFGKKTFLVGHDANGNDIVVANPDPDEQSPSGYGLWSVIQKIGFKATDYLVFNYGFYHSNTSDVPRYDRLLETDENGVPYDAEWYYGPQRWTMHSLKTTITKPTTFFDQAKATVAYQDYEESRMDRGFGDPRLRTRTEEVDVYSLNLDFDKQFGKNHFFYGAEVLYNDIASSAMRVNQETGEVSNPDSRYPNGGSSYTSYAAYTSYNHHINKQWIISAGLRYSFVELEANYEDDGSLGFPFSSFELSNGALNGSMGLVYKPNEVLKTNVSLASGFRSPNIDDVGKIFDFSDGELQVPNPGLKPEYSYNAEAGFEWEITDGLEVGISGFYTWLDNAMVRDDFSLNGQDSVVFSGEPSKVVALVNTSEAGIYGYHVEVEAEFSSYLAFQATITNTFGKDRSNSEPLRHTTPLFGRAALIFQKDKLRIEQSMVFNGNRFRNDIPDAEIVDKPVLYAMHDSDPSKDGSPGWAVFNLKGSYQIGKYVNVTGGVENIFNLHYRPYSSGISAPGRNFILAVRASF